MRRLAGFVLLSLLLHLPLQADEIAIDTASIHQRNHLLMLDANLKVALGDAVIEAINSGVELSFDLFIQVQRPRRWLWSERLASSTYRFTLQYHALSNQYLLTDVIHRRQRVLRSLEEALEALGHLRDIPVSGERQLSPDRGLEVVLSMELDIESLPAPMRPVAYLSPSWHISSDAHRITLKP